ncbi:Multicopper oxidase mco [Poriferisphaera corsica]|uniref:Multicopper oxidase mco n=1 Tax=Poriferisphaera corsica TaxID=2528020 RepID=A0A517YYP6_9BACT|nr:multicopper oxidase domain-containing protein [Poriferisphaera corsica]QDU35329.1 Multicopper oxidase mco [Poriferisphaera corsica]
MARKVSRRNFFATTAAAIAGSAAAIKAHAEDVTAKKAIKNALTSESAEIPEPVLPLSLDGNSYKLKMEDALEPLPMDPARDSFPRVDMNRSYSMPPATMGRQMGRVQTIGQPALGYEMDGNVKVFRLIAQPIETNITYGFTKETYTLLDESGPYEQFRYRPTASKKLLGWGFNGICPGPTLEAFEGDRVRIIVRNELPQPTSIHWHGFKIPFAQDGATGYFPWNASRPILPGDEQTYEFTLHQSGTLMYHSGFNVLVQEGMGLAGMFIVHPKKEEHPIDCDIAILLQQWNFFPGNAAPNLMSMEAKIATFNGKTLPTLPMIHCKQGDRVRIRFGNLSLLSHPIHLHGYDFEVVGTTGGPIPKTARYRESTIDIAPGQTRDIELVAWNPGTWRLHCHVLHHTVNMMANAPMGIMPPEGMFTYLQVEPRNPNDNPKSPDAPWKYEGDWSKI